MVAKIRSQLKEDPALKDKQVVLDKMASLTQEASQDMETYGHKLCTEAAKPGELQREPSDSAKGRRKRKAPVSDDSNDDSASSDGEKPQAKPSQKRVDEGTSPDKIVPSPEKTLSGLNLLDNGDEDLFNNIRFRPTQKSAEGTQAPKGQAVAPETVESSIPADLKEILGAVVELSFQVDADPCLRI